MIAAGILTFNQFKTGRASDFQRTLASIRAANVAHVVVTNGSTDGTETLVRDLGGIVDDTDTRIWYGMTLAANWCKTTGAGIHLFSADDIEYHPGWADALETFWKHAPDNIVLASLMIEPLYPWNIIHSQGDAGGVHYVTRASVGGCCWSWRARDIGLIFPLPPIMPGEDLVKCRELLAKGHEIAALNLADHIGETHSAWGNQSHLYALPVDLSALGFGGGVNG